VRIAVAGAHHVGKSTLVQELSAVLAGHETVDEPYHQLEEEGHQFADPPSIEDFELQLERSIESLDGDEANVIFDRCPLDLLAYLSTHEDAQAFDIEDALPRARAAMEHLDLVVFVPIEEPDRVALPRDADGRWRARVDDQLRELLVGSSADIDVPVLEVAGTVRDRVRAVLAHLRAA
jgi:predicted ATPase